MSTQIRESCEDCGRLVAVGDWPFCPHGTMAGHVFGQKPIEAVSDDMIDSSGPRTFTTIAEKVRFMDRNGIVPRGEVRVSPQSGLNPSDVRRAVRETMQEIAQGRYR